MVPSVWLIGPLVAVVPGVPERVAAPWGVWASPTAAGPEELGAAEVGVMVSVTVETGCVTGVGAVVFVTSLTEEVTEELVIAGPDEDALLEVAAAGAGAALSGVPAPLAAGGVLFAVDVPADPLLDDSTGVTTDVTRLLTPEVRPDGVPTPSAEALPDPKNKTNATAAKQARKPKVKRVGEYRDRREGLAARPSKLRYAFIGSNQQTLWTLWDCRNHGQFKTLPRRLPGAYRQKPLLSVLFWVKVTAMAV
jgi:hypothetical protein